MGTSPQRQLTLGVDMLFHQQFCTMLLGFLLVFSLTERHVASGTTRVSYDIGAICQSMWDADTNSLVYGRDFTLNIQNKALRGRDTSSRPLFKKVDKTKLNGRTFTAFKNLLDNYYMMTGKTEKLTRKVKNENNEFIRSIMATQTIKKLHRYIAGRLPGLTSTRAFANKLYKIWFYLYKRNAYRDSSGFEHVFLGETKKGSQYAQGFHNWLQFYLMEHSTKVNYHGYYTLKKAKPPVLKLKFNVDKYTKPVSSFFLGTSPEFEIGIYTACFLLKPGKECRCRVNSQLIRIKTYTWYKTEYVGTAFPVV